MINTKETKKDFLNLLSNKNLKKILDLGCGKGLMAKFFEKENVKIIGIDTKRLVNDSENFHLIEGDIRKENFGKENDLIISSLILHFFKREEAQQIINNMKLVTSNAGYNLLICMSNEDNLAKKNLEKFYPSLEEIKEIYSDWILIKEINGITEPEDHDNLGVHQHNILFLLFQKKNGDKINV